MRSERGQVLPLVAFALVVLMGLAAFSIDLGAAYLAKRQLQNAVDSAALAGAYDLPNTATATTDATAYAASNTPANTAATYGYSVNSGVLTVTGTATTNTWFARVFGLDHFHVGAHAQAIVTTAGSRLVDDGYVITAPLNTGSPTLSAPAPLAVGVRLTVANGGWSGDPPTYTYQWRRCNASGASCGNVLFATGSGYVVSPSDQGSTIRAVVTATNASGTASATTTQTGVVPSTGVAPANTAAPTISGSVAVAGNTLTVNPGTWTGTPTPTLTYQWRRCAADGISCNNLVLATATTYVLTASDNAGTIRAVVTGTNTAGAVSATTTQTAIVGYTATFTPKPTSSCAANNNTCIGSVTMTRPAGGAQVFMAWCRTSDTCTPNQLVGGNPSFTANATTATFFVTAPASGFPCRVTTSTNGTTFVPSTPISTSAAC